MTPGTVASLVGMQEPSGCFPSQVRGGGREQTDRNGFTAAMVLRTLRSIRPEAGLDGLRSRALDLLERCRSRRVTGAFTFWPDETRPPWAAAVPADLDDTAIMTVELLSHGRLEPRDGLTAVCRILIGHRLDGEGDQLLPRWIAPGAFPTWIGKRGAANVVDCCVNANAAALMALVDATHLPGYAEAVRTIASGIDWAGGRPERLRSLSPFYPSVHDLVDALAHAVECGANSLRPALDRLRSTVGGRADDDTSGCCCGAYSAVVWHCRGLEEARALLRTRRRCGAAGDRVAADGPRGQAG